VPVPFAAAEWLEGVVGQDMMEKGFPAKRCEECFAQTVPVPFAAAEWLEGVVGQDMMEKGFPAKRCQSSDDHGGDAGENHEPTVRKRRHWMRC